MNKQANHLLRSTIMIIIMLMVLLSICYSESELSNNESSNDISKRVSKTYTTFGLSYSLDEQWHHIPVDEQNDIYAIDINNINKDVIFIQVQDLSAYSRMMDTQSNKERFLNSIMSGALQTMNMKDSIFEYTINDNGILGIIRIGKFDYGVATMYMEIMNNKLFYLTLVTESYSEKNIDYVLDCVGTLVDIGSLNNDNYRSSENNGLLIQYKQENILYKVWDDWTYTDIKDEELGMNMRVFLKNNGQPSDGMLLVFKIENVIKKQNDDQRNFERLVDICTHALHIKDVEFDCYYDITESLVLGYRAETAVASPLNYSMFVTFREGNGYCFVMASVHERSINTAWLETVINTVKIQ